MRKKSFMLMFVLAALGAFAPAARAQGSRKDDMVLNARGGPQAGASVAVCTAGANTTTTPCAPLANIFKDAALTQALANPITTDGLGNYFFYASPGRYTLQIYGPGITTKVIPDVILPVDMTGVTNVSGAISAFSLSLSGNLTVTGSAAVTLGLSAPVVTMANQSSAPGTPANGNVVFYSKSDKQLYFKNDAGVEQQVGNNPNAAIKPAAAGGIQYVAFNGNDANDGLSWGTAKKTVSAALMALPNGTTSPAQAGVGTIYIGPGSSANTVSGAGIWLMGVNDPNYATPPSGWVRASGGGLALIGVGSQNAGPNAHIPQAQIVGGSTADRNHPMIWLSGVGNSTYFENLAPSGSSGRGVVIGECSNNVRTGTCSSAGITFRNVAGMADNATTHGPGWDITGNSFWIFMYDIGAVGNAQTDGPSPNNSAAILVDGTGNPGNGLIFINNCNLASGGIKFIPGTNANALYTDGCTMEGSLSLAMPPPVWITDNGTAGFNRYVVRNLTMADFSSGHPTAVVQKDGFHDASELLVENPVPCCGSVSVTGAAQVTDFSAGALAMQSGFEPVGSPGMLPKLIAQHDGYPRNFGPVAVRVQNLASWDSTTWVTGGCTGCTLTTGVTGPDGKTGAVRITSTSGGLPAIAFYQQNHAVAVGDWVIGLLWMRSQSGNGFANGGPYASTNTATFLRANAAAVQAQQIMTAGGWSLYRVADKIASFTSSPALLQFDVQLNSTHPIEVYAPTLIYIPAGTFADEEIAEYAAMVAPFPPTCNVGDLCTTYGAIPFGPPATASTIPQQTAFDNFIRANGTLGANWTTQVGTFSITSNQAAGGTGDNYALYNALTVQADQFAQVHITSAMGTNDFVGANVRASGTAGSAQTYNCTEHGNGTWSLNKYVGGVYTTLSSGSTAVALGDTLRLEIRGSALTCYQNGAVLATATDSSLTSGQPGFYLGNSAATADNFSGGNISAIAAQNIEGDWTKAQHFLGGATLPLFTVANLPASVVNGSLAVATDGTPGSSPCTGGGSGALAVRIGGAWVCK